MWSPPGHGRVLYIFCRAGSVQNRHPSIMLDGSAYIQVKCFSASRSSTRTWCTAPKVNYKLNYRLRAQVDCNCRDLYIRLTVGMRVNWLNVSISPHSVTITFSSRPSGSGLLFLERLLDRGIVSLSDHIWARASVSSDLMARKSLFLIYMFSLV